MKPSPQQQKVEAALSCIERSFEDYHASFSDITRRARRRFIACDRQGMTQDVAARYALYDASIHETIAKLEQILGERLFSRPIWTQLKSRYQAATEHQIDKKLYRTFFNTVARRLFKTEGVDPSIEFTAPTHVACDEDVLSHLALEQYEIDLSRLDSVAQLLHAMSKPWGLTIDAHTIQLTSQRLSALESKNGAHSLSIEMLPPIFYRGGRAYRVGHLKDRPSSTPLVLAFKAGSEGIELEAILTQRRDISILFGFTFNYFMVDLDFVEPAVRFIARLLPSKPVAELYTVLGRVKQGKTERYQSFFAHLSDRTGEQLVEAEGKKGMVMLVFTLPSYPLVFKLIRDRFAPSKQVTRSDVLERYHLVFRHDRVGRLIDAQEFRELKLPLSLLSPSLYETLNTECSRLIEQRGDELVIHHCYVERRVRPLDLYLAESDDGAANKAVIDYGQSIKDLARSNIFAGDLLPKNFGVTGSGRVVFYDYDELRLMSECRFRHWPEASDDLMSMSDEPWFYVGEDDVFPEQFSLFMGLGPDRLACLKAHHGELFDAQWWIDTQQTLAGGASIDVPPFSAQSLLTEA